MGTLIEKERQAGVVGKTLAVDGCERGFRTQVKTCPSPFAAYVGALAVEPSGVLLYLAVATRLESREGRETLANNPILRAGRSNLSVEANEEGNPTDAKLPLQFV